MTVLPIAILCLLLPEGEQNSFGRNETTTTSKIDTRIVG